VKWRKDKTERLPANVRLAQDAIVKQLGPRLVMCSRHELMEWSESSAIGADAALRSFQQDPRIEHVELAHALASQLFALTYELKSRETEQLRRGTSISTPS
jgi:hypothetical protein